MFKNWKQRRLRELRDELKGMVAARIASAMDDGDEKKQEGKEIVVVWFVEDLLVDERELRLKIARIEARL